ncbi:hypothetical protein HanRHA438_Chr08g0347481 [Helianthus annuus]|nr:hypothetical protein HanRHA438_Chr08g0347481 [Helianthus annuus]
MDAPPQSPVFDPYGFRSSQVPSTRGNVERPLPIYDDEDDEVVPETQNLGDENEDDEYNVDEDAGNEEDDTRIKREKWRAKNGPRSKKRRWRRRGYIALPTKRRAINKTAIVFGVRFLIILTPPSVEVTGPCIKYGLNGAR